MNWYKIIKFAFPRGVPQKWSPKQLEDIGEYLEAGFSFVDIGKHYGVSSTLIENLNRKYHWRDTGVYKKLTDTQKKEIKDLYINQKLTPVEISKRTGIIRQTIIPFLEREGIYIKPEPKRFFKPSKKEIEQIDKWYLLPPEGEGKAIYWIAEQFDINKKVLEGWFTRTKRPMRSLLEQNQQKSTKQQRSKASIAQWEKAGFLKGRLMTFSSRIQAMSFLNGFIGNSQNFENNNHRNVTYTKYKKMINEDNIYPEDLIPPTTNSREEALRKLNEYNSRLGAESFIRADELFTRLQQVITGAQYPEDQELPPPNGEIE